MKPSQIEAHLGRAQRAINFAHDTRTYHRRRTRHGSKQRATDIEVAQKKLRDAMGPLRRYRGMAQYFPPSDAQDELNHRVAEASKALQAERRRLWKLANPTRKTDRAS